MLTIKEFDQIFNAISIDGFDYRVHNNTLLLSYDSIRNDYWNGQLIVGHHVIYERFLTKVIEGINKNKKICIDTCSNRILFKHFLTS